MPSHVGQEDQTMGRPSLYSDELAAEICERLAAGESLNAICRDKRMPSRKVVHEWIADDRNGFRYKYARAREMQVEHYADEIIDIADAVAGETESAVVQAAKLAIDTRKWIAAKRLPKKYGDKVQVGSDPDNPAKTVDRVESVFVSPGERAQRGESVGSAGVAEIQRRAIGVSR
jgi:hypothetical protein